MTIQFTLVAEVSVKSFNVLSSLKFLPLSNITQIFLLIQGTSLFIFLFFELI